MMRRSVLIVDDDPGVRRFIITNLKKRGYEVAEATTVDQGLEALALNPPDLIVLEPQISLSYPLLLAAVKSQPRLADVQIVLFTTLPCLLVDQMVQCRQIVDVVYKPAEAAALVEAVQRALSSPRLAL